MALESEAKKMVNEGKMKVIGSGRELLHIDGPGDIKLTFPLKLRYDLRTCLKRLTCTCKDSSVKGDKRLCSYKLAALKVLFEGE